MPVEPGQTLSHYRLIEKIGEGGMGVVWSAEDTRLRRTVALKILPEEFANSPDRLSRFEREARFLASLNHTNIASIYGLEKSDPTRFLVLELVPGETLAERLERGPIPLKESLTLCTQLATALEAAHNKGIIHRDLKPANIKVTPEGQVKVLDFGLAKAYGTISTASQASAATTITMGQTREHAILGTAPYMSPEQASGKALDKRTDIWAFGCVLYEMLTGRSPFARESNAESIAAVLEREPDWDALPGDLPLSIGKLIRRCLVKNADDRLHDVADARIEIDDSVSGQSEITTVAGVRARPLWQLALPWSLVVLISAIAAAAVWGLWKTSPGSLLPTDRAGPAPIMRLRVEVGAGQVLDDEAGAAAVLSPDGSMLAYAANDGAVTRLYLRDLDKPEGVPQSGTEGVRAPFFSPDGKWIGFFSNRHLKKVSIAGGAPLSLAETGTNRGGTWSADGTIVFSPDITSGLVRVPDTGGTPEPITELSEGERSHRWPYFLPDGKHVLFIAQDEGVPYDNSTIEAVNIDTKERTVLHEGGTYPRYLPSGHLVYVRGGTLFAARLDTSRLAVESTPAPILETVLARSGANTGDGTAYYAFSGNGTLVYVEGSIASQRYTVLWSDRDGNHSPLLEESRPYDSPRLSPDGRQLALQISEDVGSDLWVYDLERDVLTRLTFTGSEDFLQTWTLDSRRIVFSSTQEGKLGIFSMPADGSDRPELIWQDGRIRHPVSFSPEGHLATQALNPDSSWDIEVIRFEDGRPLEPETFLATPSVDAFPNFSPDGRWLAYVSNESGQFEVYARPYPGPGGKWQISTSGGSTPRWTKGGRELVYRKRNQWLSVPLEAEENRLRVGRPEVVLEGTYVDLVGYYAYDVTADGERFVLFQGDDNVAAPAFTHLNFILNWFDEVKRIAPTRQ